MPAQPSWIHRLDAIRAAVAECRSPVLDRAALETLFGVGRRRAIELLHQLGGYQAGKTFLIERTELLRQLEEWAGSAGVRRETGRRRRVAEELERARLQQRGRGVAIAPTPGSGAAGLRQLPGVTWAPGELRIRFSGSEELLSRLLGLTLAVQGDLDEFEEVCKTHGG
ncbi:MAG: hypothetical protein IT162_12605 [Bryobacterales bacterium]|nr:hypothetical protein [Bryobacterales bacterium]